MATAAAGFVAYTAGVGGIGPSEKRRRRCSAFIQHCVAIGGCQSGDIVGVQRAFGDLALFGASEHRGLGPVVL